jgi:hypothetical protein
MHRVGQPRCEGTSGDVRLRHSQGRVRQAHSISDLAFTESAGPPESCLLLTVISAGAVLPEEVLLVKVFRYGFGLWIRQQRVKSHGGNLF